MDEPQQVTPRLRAKGRHTGFKVVLVVPVVAVAVLAIILYTLKSDRALSEACVGTWRAVDPANAALHLEESDVESETAVIRPDGTLEYIVKRSPPTETERRETWGWKIEMGQLHLRFRGSGDTEPWLAPLKISVAKATLRIHRDGYPVKEFERVGP